MENNAYWIGFNKVNGIGPARMKALLDVFGSLEAAWTASPMALAQSGALDRRSLANLLAVRSKLDLQAEWERVRRAGVDLLTWSDERYPLNLARIDGPPPVLYVDGAILEEDAWAVAIVGTRRATAYGREIAHTLATELARNRITVVSGLALGVDTIAHQAALDAGGRTIAVLGSGVDVIYPHQNRLLAKAIAQQGAVVSEYALGVRPEASNFPPRNRIISGLSRGVIVVEAGERSGALITARFAADQNRDVFAVPGSILRPGSAGCNRLIQDGAIPLLSIDDVLDQLNLARVDDQRVVQQSVPADPLEAELLAHLSQEPRHVDEIVRRSALPPAQASSLLAIMELKGLVRQVGAMCYVRA